jgi:hypothetical protein
MIKNLINKVNLTNNYKTNLIKLNNKTNLFNFNNNTLNNFKKPLNNNNLNSKFISNINIIKYINNIFFTTSKNFGLKLLINKNKLKSLNLKKEIIIEEKNKLLENIKINSMVVSINNNNLLPINLKNKKKEIVKEKNTYQNNYNNLLNTFIRLSKNNKNINLQKKIRNYINSIILFNSNSGKIISTNNNFLFNRYNQINSSLKISINEFFQMYFFSMFSLISKPFYIIKADKIIIKFFYFLFKNKNINNNKTESILILLNKDKLQIICNYLSRFLKKPIELDLIRLYYPHYNSEILVNFFGIFINKIKLRRIINKFLNRLVKNKLLYNLNKNFLPSKIAGIKIKIAGRLLTQRVIPRKTSKLIKKGAFARNKIMFIETARFTNKNKKGAFSITISIGY